jgi:16S rRNA (cytosine1402-N4)-methyltransferase
MNNYHKPVLLKEILELLQIGPGLEFIDATLGGGGHTCEILKLGGIVLGICAKPFNLPSCQ